MLTLCYNETHLLPEMVCASAWAEIGADSMDQDEFLTLLQTHVETFGKAVADAEGEWIVKGFIDVYRNVYSISVDTKIVSKVLELLLFPMFKEFAREHDLQYELSPQQNFYPDLTFIDRTSGRMFAVDVKSTYRTDDSNVNGMTLGAFTGYFRNRDSNKNTTYPYGQYCGHYVLGVIYTKCDGVADERNIFKVDDLENIPSVIRDFTFFAQTKYRIAGTRPGSGNTKNIGSVSKIAQLLNGTGPFAGLGENVYDDYWMYYMTTDMAKKLDMERPYNDLKTYHAYKTRGIDVLRAHEHDIAEYTDDQPGNGVEEE